MYVEDVLTEEPVREVVGETELVIWDSPSGHANDPNIREAEFPLTLTRVRWAEDGKKYRQRTRYEFDTDFDLSEEAGYEIPTGLIYLSEVVETVTSNRELPDLGVDWAHEIFVAQQFGG